MADHELLLHDQFGVRQRELRQVTWGWARRVNAVGAATINVPWKTGLEYRDIKPDQIVSISRGLPGGQSVLEGETLWFAVGRQAEESGLTIYLEDANTILRRRIVAYAAASSQASKSGAAFNLIRAVLRENFGSLSPADRDVSKFLAVQPDDGFGATVVKDFAWRKVIDVIREVAEASEEAGYFCGFDVVCTRAPLGQATGSTPAFGLEFRCFRNQRGIDHRWPSGNPPILIGSQYGSLANPKVVEMWKGEESFVYAGGKGQEADRLVDSAARQSRIDLSPFGRMEGFRNASRVDTAAGLRDEASAQIAEKASRTVVSGEFRETPRLRYGVDVRFGDFVTVDQYGARVDVRMNAVQVSKGREGETIKASLEGSY